MDNEADAELLQVARDNQAAFDATLESYVDQNELYLCFGHIPLRRQTIHQPLRKRSPNMARYTDEYRREAVDYVLASGRPITECARELGVNDKTLNDWVLKFKRRGEVTGAMTAEEADVAALRRENERLRQENEFLKKAAAFFARSQA